MREGGWVTGTPSGMGGSGGGLCASVSPPGNQAEVLRLGELGTASLGSVTAWEWGPPGTPQAPAAGWAPGRLFLVREVSKKLLVARGLVPTPPPRTYTQNLYIHTYIYIHIYLFFATKPEPFEAEKCDV